MATITQQEAAQFIKKLGFEPLTQIEFDAFIETADGYDAAFAAAGYSDAKFRHPWPRRACASTNQQCFSMLRTFKEKSL